MNKIKVGISTCLLGKPVRYDGSHKLDRYLVNILGGYVEWVPVCPEVECGLPTPRESMRLVGSPDDFRLVTNKTGIDHTDRMLEWADSKLKELESHDLCGFIFKKRSPSSALGDAKVYTEKGFPARKGPGLFAGEYLQRFPAIPVEDEGRLHDDGIRENFIERLFAVARWREFIDTDGSIKGLIRYHMRHKLILMAHSAVQLRELGKLVANPQKLDKNHLFDQYFSLMMETLKLKATVKKNVNVLHHAMGYFKKKIASDAKQELLEVIDTYHQELVPLIVPITLVNHYTRMLKESYLMDQYYLNPHPMELKLRNHV
jgi:uncharacterized protein YbgA (DUF1722 family)/uncharacterized protein YbbK (DUF523 family)